MKLQQLKVGLILIIVNLLIKTQVRSNQLAVSKVQRRQSRITEDPFTGTINSNNSNGSTGNPLLAPSNPTNASSSSLEGAIEQSHQIITPTLSRSATAGVSSSLAPSVYLRIEVHPTADVSYTTTVSVPSDMYLQDVLEMVGYTTNESSSLINIFTGLYEKEPKESE